MHNHYRSPFIVLLCAVLLVTGCVEMSLPRGSGTVVREVRSVDNFTAISICCGIHLEFTQGDQTTVELEGDDNLLSEIETFVQDDHLTIRFRRALTFSWRNRPVTAYITAPTLHGLDLSGGAEANVESVATDHLQLDASGGSHINITTLQADQLSVDLSGGAEVAIDAGTIEEQEVTASGGSHYLLENVQSGNAALELSGGSEARVRVSESLRVDASGGSEVEYYGSPNVNQDTSGGSRVRSIGN